MYCIIEMFEKATCIADDPHLKRSSGRKMKGGWGEGRTVICGKPKYLLGMKGIGNSSV